MSDRQEKGPLSTGRDGSEFLKIGRGKGEYWEQGANQ